MGGVPMGYLDFTPEPPAPSATPVTEHVDLNLGHSHDTRDLSSKYFPFNSYSFIFEAIQPCPCVLLGATPNGEVRIKFETLKSLDPAETMDIENHLSPHTISQQQSQQQQQQQHQSSSTPTHIMVDQQSRHSSHHSNSPQPQNHQQSQQQNSSPPGMGADDSSDQLDIKPNVHQLMQGNTNGITTNNHIQIHAQQQQQTSPSHQQHQQQQQHQLNQHQMQQLQQQIQQQQQSFDQMNTATINIVASPTPLTNNGINIQILSHGQSLTQFNGIVMSTADLVPNMNMMNAGNPGQMQQGNER